MPSKTKTALAALFILGPVSVVVLAGPNNRTDDHGSVRTVLVSNGRTGVVSPPRRRGRFVAAMPHLAVGLGHCRTRASTRALY